MASRVVVTGLGAFTAAGRSVPALWQSLSGGQTAIGPLTSVDVRRLRFQNGAEVQNYSPGDFFSDKQVDLLDRFAQFALLAAREAMDGCADQWTPEVKARAAVVTGNCLGGKQHEGRMYAEHYGPDEKRPHPLTIVRGMGNAAASHLSMEFGLTGPTFNLATACASSNHAIGQAFTLVRSGVSPAALTGGSESPFELVHLKCWESLRVVAPDTCRPFSRDRRGMILGEGAALLVLEPLEAAQSRGAVIHAEIVGFGMSADAHHITQPSAQGAARAMAAALVDAGIRPDQVGYINAHGTGTAANDATETEAIRMVFQQHADRLVVSSTKSMHGHALGAAGAIEAVATILALREGVLPPTANYTEPDPACNLDVIPNEARPAHVEYALSNSFAFGGLNAVLVFKAWRG